MSLKVNNTAGRELEAKLEHLKARRAAHIAAGNPHSVPVEETELELVQHLLATNQVLPAQILAFLS